MKEINAKIEDTMLGFEDHGIFTCMIYLDFGDSSHQGFGGYSLGNEYTNRVITGLLKTLEIDQWESLKGKYVRIRKEDDKYNSKITEIGHLLKDQWFKF